MAVPSFSHRETSSGPGATHQHAYRSPAGSKGKEKEIWLLSSSVSLGLQNPQEGSRHINTSSHSLSEKESREKVEIAANRSCGIALSNYEVRQHPVMLVLA